MKSAELSVYILAFNEAEKIRDAIASVQWADEIIVVDSGSVDHTADIARSMGARVVQIPFEGFGRLRNGAIAACTHEWIFSLDADERCTPDARAEIQGIITAADALDAYYVPRRNFFLGRWIRHGGWYPDYRQPQLFRRGALTFRDEDEVHEGYTVHGRTGHMHHAILQIPYRDLAELIDKMQRYSTLGAGKLARRGVHAGLGSAFLHALGAFLRIYIIKRGFLDGWAGFVIALGNFEGTFYRYAKLAERQQQLNIPASPPE